MLFLSDMSGSSMLNGFESYITGYPLQDDGFYALGKTWYAPEMNRPGCVWTHTLIIKNPDMAKIKDLFVLLELFKRPEVPFDYDLYRENVCLDSVCLSSNKHINSELVDYEGLLKAIYLNSGPAYLFASDASLYERAIFDVWSQQWPRLRRCFSFCTGSISDRNSSVMTFDLQVMPIQKKREIVGKTDIDKKPRNSFLHKIDFLEIVKGDLLGREEESFRRFLWDYGADIETGRFAFLPMAEIFDYSNSSSLDKKRSEEIINILGKNFQHKNDAARLKKSIFKLFCNSNYLNCNQVNKLLLYQLAKTPYQDSFDSDKIELNQKIKTLWYEDKKETLNFISDLLLCDLNSLGQSLIKHFSSLVDLSDIGYISKEKPHILYVLASLKPSLLADSRLWEVMVENQLSLLSEAIRGKKIENKLHFDIFSAILNSGADVSAMELVDIFGISSIGYFLQWFDICNESDSFNIPSGWGGEIRNNFSAAIEWVQKRKSLRDETIAFFLSFINPQESEVKYIDSDVLLRFSNREFSSLAPKKRSDIRSFFLTLGLRGVGQAPYVFIADSFQEVHDAAKENRLSATNWRQLERQLPELGWWREWDKCERLRRGLATVFFHNDWPVKYFLLAIRDKNTFMEVVHFLRKKSWGHKFLLRIKASNALSEPGVEDYKVNSLS